MMDFMSNRNFLVEVNGSRSGLRPLDLGCVQGSVLGPLKLFNLYMKDLTTWTGGFTTTTYADDTYVLIIGDNPFQLKQHSERCLQTHLGYLDNQGMVTNISNTEAVVFGNDMELELNTGNSIVKTNKQMKVLVVVFDCKMSWNPQVDQAIARGRRLCGGFKFIRKKLNIQQFLKVLTCQFYSAVYDGCDVWLGTNTFNDMRRLKALHYRSLRVATRDFKRRQHHTELDNLGRTRSSTWSKYLTLSRIIKVINHGYPVQLQGHLRENSYRKKKAWQAEILPQF